MRRCSWAGHLQGDPGASADAVSPSPWGRTPPWAAPRRSSCPFSRGEGIRVSIFMRFSVQLRAQGQQGSPGLGVGEGEWAKASWSNTRGEGSFQRTEDFVCGQSRVGWRAQD